MNKQKLLGLCSIAVLLTGCATRGAYIKQEEVPKIQETVTTAEELEKALGVPSVTVPRDDGKTMWVYQGIHKSADAASYIPYLNLLAGGNNKECTRLTVLVDRETGKLSDWQYSAATGHEFWAKTNDKCSSGKKNDGQ